MAAKVRLTMAQALVRYLCAQYTEVDGESAEIQELYLAGRKEEAIAAVPDDYCDEQALVGPPTRIRDRYTAWESSGATGLILSCRRVEGLELMAELTGSQDRANDGEQ